MKIVNSEVEKAPNEVVRALSELNSTTEKAITSLKDELIAERVDFESFTKTVNELFEKAAEKLEALNTQPDYSSLVESISSQLKELKEATNSVSTEVAKQDYSPTINVPPPDFSRLNGLLKAIPQTIDNSLKNLNNLDAEEARKNFRKIIELLEKIAAKEWVSGGTTVVGGSAVQETLISNNSLVTTPKAYATKITVAGTISYIAKAEPGTLYSTAAWQVQKVDETDGTIITWADGNANFDNTATDLTALSYS